jgi:glucan 1,3-beta-glucosidase
MLRSSLILSLSACAFALHVRYEGVYGYGDSLSQESSTNIVYTPQPSSKSTPGYSHQPSGVPFPIDGNSTSGMPSPTGTPNCAPYWLENIKHQGLASFNPNVSSYEVFRNVKDYGAKGDGRTDDTAAIQRAITEGNRCTPGYCESSTTTPALVYFPGGTYIISASIIDYYYTQVRSTYSAVYLQRFSILILLDHRQS